MTENMDSTERDDTRRHSLLAAVAKYEIYEEHCQAVLDAKEKRDAAAAE